MNPFSSPPLFFISLYLTPFPTYLYDLKPLLPSPEIVYMYYNLMYIFKINNYIISNGIGLQLLNTQLKQLRKPSSQDDL